MRGVTWMDAPPVIGLCGTPAVCRGKCYFVGAMGLYCLSAQDGALIWKVKCPPAHASVLVANNVVYSCGAAYNTETGRLIWKTQLWKGTGREDQLRPVVVEVRRQDVCHRRRWPQFGLLPRPENRKRHLDFQVQSRLVALRLCEPHRRRPHGVRGQDLSHDSHRITAALHAWGNRPKAMGRHLCLSSGDSPRPPLCLGFRR